MSFVKRPRMALHKKSEAGAHANIAPWGYTDVPYKITRSVILKTSLALPVMSFVKSPRMDFSHKKERSGCNIIAFNRQAD